MSSLPPHPLCIACGVLIGFEEVYGGLNLRFPSMDLIDAQSPVIRGSYYRAIFRPNKDAPYQLSGIGRFNGEMGELHVPLYTDEECCFWFPPNPHGTTVQMDEVNFLTSFNDQSPGPYGYRVHMWCWSLIKRIIGPAAEENLDLLIKVLHERWDEKPFEIPEYVMRPQPRPDFEPPAEVGWPDPEPLARGREGKGLTYGGIGDFIGVRKVSNPATKNVIQLRDPSKAPNFRKLFKKCSENHSRKEIKRKTRKWCTNAKTLPVNHLGMPLELQFMILDLLDYMDVRNTLLAFGWQIPDIYWRSRYPYDLIFELEDMNLSSCADMDWKTFCLTIEQMLENVPELQNRRRIFRILKATKRLFNSKRGLDC